MNHYLKSQIENMIAMTRAFESGCHMAVMQNDGKIDKDEAKALKKVEAAAEQFIKEISNVIKNK